MSSREKIYLFLEEAGPECYLVLLHATRVSRSFRCHIILPTTRPVFVILQVIRNELRPQNGREREKERKKELERSRIFIYVAVKHTARPRLGLFASRRIRRRKPRQYNRVIGGSPASAIS